MKIISQKQLQKNLIEIIDHHGEGLILYQPLSTYQRGRTSSLMKIKVCKKIFI